MAQCYAEFDIKDAVDEYMETICANYAMPLPSGEPSEPHPWLNKTTMTQRFDLSDHVLMFLRAVDSRMADGVDLGDVGICLAHSGHGANEFANRRYLNAEFLDAVAQQLGAHYVEVNPDGSTTYSLP